MRFILKSIKICSGKHFYSLFWRKAECEDGSWFPNAYHCDRLLSSTLIIILSLAILSCWLVATRARKNDDGNTYRNLQMPPSEPQHEDRISVIEGYLSYDEIRILASIPRKKLRFIMEYKFEPSHILVESAKNVNVFVIYGLFLASKTWEMIAVFTFIKPINSELLAKIVMISWEHIRHAHLSLQL